MSAEKKEFDWGQFDKECDISALAEDVKEVEGLIHKMLDE